MAGLDPFTVVARAVIIAVFGAAFLLSFFFTFFVRDFLRLEERFIDIDVLSRSLINPLKRNVRMFYEWCVMNHQGIGLILMGASLWVLVTLYKIVAVL